MTIAKTDITFTLATNVQTTFTFNIKDKMPIDFIKVLSNKLMPKPGDAIIYELPQGCYQLVSDTEFNLTVNYTGPNAKLNAAAGHIKDMIFAIIKALEDLQTALDALAAI